LGGGRRRTHDGGEEWAERGEEVGDGQSGSGDGEEQHQRGAAGEPSHLGFLILDAAAAASSPTSAAAPLVSAPPSPCVGGGYAGV
jgi:hypothetical protein